MKKEARYYVVFPRKLIDEIKWPSDWGNHCGANLAPMLGEQLRVKRIGSEIKMIWNEHHRSIIIADNDVTHQQVDDYLKADCSLLSFPSDNMMKRAVKALRAMGTSNLIELSSYRDVILEQAHYYNHKQFSKTGPDGHQS